MPSFSLNPGNNRVFRTNAGYSIFSPGVAYAQPEKVPGIIIIDNDTMEREVADRISGELKKMAVTKNAEQ